MTELLGHDVDRYHIVEQLGTGGMATVYKAYDSRLERDVAIKFIRPDVVRDEMFLKRFEREAKALARLSHTNIVKVLDYGEYNGLPYLVMEYIRGDTLKAKLGKPIPWREAARMLMPIAEALEYTHKQNIIHRDVKPSNFLMTESNDLLLSDFGIAKMLDNPEAVQLTGTGIGIGTPEYMSPEQGLGQPVDQRSDVYSLGVVFYEMVTGQKPYHADTPLAVMYKQISDPLPPPRSFIPNLPENVEHTLFKALAKKPDDRYQSMDEFARALQEIVETPDNIATRITSSALVQTQTSPVQTAFHPAEYPSAPSQPKPVAPSEINEVKQPKKSKKVWLTCGVLALVGVCLGVIALTGGFGALIALFGTPPEGLTVNITIPQTIEMGGEFQIIVSLGNESDKEITVNEIQVPNVLLTIATLNTTSPLYSEITKYDATQSTGYTFDLTIPAGGRKEVRFYLSPLQTADVTGDWSIFVGTHSLTTSARVIIIEATTSTSTTTFSPTLMTSATLSPEVFSTQTAPVLSDWTLLWEDDFSDSNSGFYVGESDDRSFWYENDEYKIKIVKPNWLAWVTLGYSLSDVRMTIDGKQETSGGDAAYGLICRLSDNDEFYGFEFREDGAYSIWLRYNDDYTYLVDWTYDGRIQDNGWQNMTAECTGTTLTLMYDGEIIATTTDTTLSSGDVGVLGESGSTGNTVLTFDNFSLYQK